MEDIKNEGKVIPNSRTYLCPEAGELSRQEDRQNYFTKLVAFLN